MLIEFSIENFRSIKERVTLSLVSSPDKSLDYNLIKTDPLEKDSLLRSAVIYGANASGKSNVVSAFLFLKRLVTNSHNNQKDTKIKVSPFKLDNSSKPSKFEAVFIKNNIKYIYGVSVTDERIIDEYLYHYPKGRKALIFKRENTTNYKFTTDENEQQFLSKRTLENVLYLSSSTQLNYKKTSEAFDWFNDNLIVMSALDLLDGTKFTANLLNKDNNLKEFILKALIVADLGIADISAAFENISSDISLSSDKLNFYTVSVSQTSPAGDSNTTFISDGKGSVKRLEIKTIHTIFKGKSNELSIPFEFYEESDGTQKMFALIGRWVDALSNGHTLIIDELDTKLHHLSIPSPLLYQ